VIDFRQARLRSNPRFRLVPYDGLQTPELNAFGCLRDDPDFFVTKLREFMCRPEFAALTPKLEYSMLGRSYALGHEPDLEDWLFEKPRRTATNPDWPWAVGIRALGPQYPQPSPLDNQKATSIDSGARGQIASRLLRLQVRLC